MPNEKYKLPPDRYIGKDRIIGFQDPNTGVDYVGVLPSLEEQQWVSKWIDEEGLENLCKKYPYQPLKIDKDKNILVACDPRCEYLATLTNCFHVLYHMRNNKNHVQGDPSLDYNPMEHLIDVDVSQNKNNSCTSTQSFSLKDKLVDNNNSNQCYMPDLKSAYHQTEEEIKYDIPLNKDSYVVNEEKDELYSFDATKIKDNIFSSSLPEGYQNYHPNRPVQQQYYQYPNYYQQQASIPNYNYNPSYLPSYNSSTNVGMGAFGCFNDAYAARNNYVQNTLQNVNQYNPNRLETSSVDFSNPEFLNRMQRPSNPYATVAVNPNITYGNTPQQGVLRKTTINPSYLPNYGYTTCLNNTQYNYGYNNYNPWLNNRVDNCSWMEPTEEDYQMGIFPRVRIIKGDEEEKEVKKDPINEISYMDRLNPKKIKLKVSVVMGDEEEDKKEEKEETKASVNMGLNLMKEASKAIDKLEGNDSKPYTYDNIEEEKIEQLADQIAPYDLAVALSLTDAMDHGYTEEEFNLYKEWVEEKVEYYRTQEMMFPNIDFRLPYRHRRVPAHIQIGPGENDIDFLPEPDQKDQIKKYDANGKRVYDYDCGFDFDDGNYDAFKIFFLKAIKDRDKIILRKKMEKFSSKEGKTDRQIKLDMRNNNNMSFNSSLDDNDDEVFNPYDPLSVQRYYYKQRQKELRNQYSVFRTGVGKRMTDEEFDRWWNYGTTELPDKNKPLTFEEAKKRRIKELNAMTARHSMILYNAVPINYGAMANRFLNNAYGKIREFEQGWMDDCKGLQMVFDKLGYLVNRVREYDWKEQMEEAAYKVRTSFNRTAALHQFVNDPNYTVNPNMPKLENPEQYGLPQGSVNFMGLPEYKDKRSKFIEYCRTHMGITTPLKPIYK